MVDTIWLPVRICSIMYIKLCFQKMGEKYNTTFFLNKALSLNDSEYHESMV